MGESAIVSATLYLAACGDGGGEGRREVFVQPLEDGAAGRRIHGGESGPTVDDRRGVGRGGCKAVDSLLFHGGSGNYELRITGCELRVASYWDRKVCGYAGGYSLAAQDCTFHACEVVLAGEVTCEVEVGNACALVWAVAVHAGAGFVDGLRDANYCAFE